MDDLVTWLRAQLDDDERVARMAADGPWCREGAGQIVGGPGGQFLIAARSQAWNGDHIARHDPARVLVEVDAKRRILDEHLPEWRTVEWPHDQNGRGEAQACRRCQTVEHTTWNPPIGEAGVLPEGFVTPYVLAPCLTLRLLALPYAGRPGYREEWRP